MGAAAIKVTGENLLETIASCGIVLLDFWVARSDLCRSFARHGFDSASLSGGLLTLRLVLGDRAGNVLVHGAW